jgi:alkylhydroperoxidase/carboxymuconolactone decarboxylase family protein YurZ
MAADARQASDQQRDRLRGMAQGDEGAIADVVRIDVAAAGIDDKTHALTNLASLITTGIPDPANYVVHVMRAMDAGCSADEIIGTMVAITPNIGMVKTIAAAPFLAAALNIDVPSGGEEGGGRFDRSSSQTGAGARAGASTTGGGGGGGAGS